MAAFGVSILIGLCMIWGEQYEQTFSDLTAPSYRGKGGFGHKLPGYGKFI